MPEHALPAPDWLARSSVYQINPRTFCPEGTLNAISKELAKLAEMGFGVIYLCPIFEADASCDRAGWSERQKKYGTENPKNPYRMMDYFTIDEEYGTMDDLRALVDECHLLGMRVLLDLVYAHIGPNARILKSHPEFAQHDENGNIVTTQWHFPALDFTCSGLCEYLWSNMAYYVGVVDADGFRCDVGDAVPVSFWQEGRRRIRAIKPDAALINEGSHAESLSSAFDSMYCFPWHTAIHQVLTGKQPPRHLQEIWEECAQNLPEGGLLLRDMDNHDTVTDWPGRVETLAGHDGMEAILAMNYALDGVPMVYCGNELGDSANINMFANRFFPGVYETTDRSIASEPYSLRRQAVMKQLNAWKREKDALRYGTTRWLNVDAQNAVTAFEREWQNEKILYLGNFTQNPVTLTCDALTGGRVFLCSGVQTGGSRLTLPPRSYIILEIKTEGK